MFIYGVHRKLVFWDDLMIVKVSSTNVLQKWGGAVVLNLWLWFQNFPYTNLPQLGLIEEPIAAPSCCSKYLLLYYWHLWFYFRLTILQVVIILLGNNCGCFGFSYDWGMGNLWGIFLFMPDSPCPPQGFAWNCLLTQWVHVIVLVYSVAFLFFSGLKSRIHIFVHTMLFGGDNTTSPSLSSGLNKKFFCSVSCMFCMLNDTGMPSSVSIVSHFNLDR